MEFIKIVNGAPVREPLPDFLLNAYYSGQIGLPELRDMHWIGSPDYDDLAWYPAVDITPPLARYQSYTGVETLTINYEDFTVIVSREIRDWTAQEIHDWKASTTRHITKLAFRNRFTQAEKIAFEMAQVDDPTASHDARLVAAGVRVMEKDLAASEYADMNSAAVQAGLHQLEAVGVLGAGRADEIIWADIEDSELPNQ